MQVAKGLAPSAQAAKPKGFDWVRIFNSPALWPAVLITAGLSAIFVGLFGFTFNTWCNADGYYTHGFLVPFIAGYIVYRWWPRLRQNRTKAGWLAVPFLLLVLWVAFAANRTDIYAILSLTFVATLMLTIWFVAGWRWMVALAAPVLYLLFALPVWDQVINAYTVPLQLASTKVAYHLLQLYCLHPVMTDPTVISLGGYQLQVEVACSGFKLLLALVAFGAFFLLIARLKWWKSAIFAASIIPIALLMNGLRISFVGVVGHFWGYAVGHTFHDYSGYIVIILCFLLLDRWARLLGFGRSPEEEPLMAVELTAPAKRSILLRGYAVGALLLAMGAFILAAPKVKPLPGRTEAWMDQMAPTKIGDYKVTSTYKMDPSTYQILQPYGIVCRIFGNGSKSFDVTLVASDRKTSFHDPRVCFPAQGWDFDGQRTVLLQTKTRGAIPMTVMSMAAGDGSQQLAAFFYRGPKGFYATPQALSWSMLKDQFFGHNDEAVFYRFMPQYKNANEAQLEGFIRQYMDAAPKTSGGFF